jgi:hypothetical protein
LGNKVVWLDNCEPDIKLSITGQARGYRKIMRFRVTAKSL